MINVLDSSIFNRIAAGEVVERPRSIVKELIENSIDAGAALVSVETKKGGVEYIRVTDNGGGIDACELNKAFLPHATSKISSLTDLDRIATLGFRGEALASIAAVSTVTLTSRTAGSDLGRRVVYDNGIKTDEEECGCPTGTTAVVECLFEKIPARRKFLGTAAKEDAEIEKLIESLIMANPKVSIKYIADGKTKLFSGGDGVEGALIACYGAKIFDNLISVGLETPGIAIKGYVSKPSYSRHNKNYQTLVVNGRFVVNDDIAFSVYLCYKDYLMTRQYPVYALYIDLPCDMVDVNVHPNKMEVKFADSERVKALVRRAVNEKIIGTLRSAVSADKFEFPEKAASPKTEVEKKEIKCADVDGLSELYRYRFNPNRERVIRERPFREALEETAAVSADKITRPYSDLTETHLEDDNRSAPEKFSKADNAAAIQQGLLIPAPLKVIGTLFGAYILVERENEAYFIDQHAAHERVIYDRLSQIAAGGVAVQDLLVPYVFTVSFDEGELLRNNASELKSCGFIIDERAERTFALSGTPLCCGDLNSEVFIAGLLAMVNDKRLSKLEMIKECVKQSACKAAVKGDGELSDSEISALLREMKSTDVMLCPHGRPIAVKICKAEMEKWFKRRA